jgi:hypothetical protein
VEQTKAKVRPAVFSRCTLHFSPGILRAPAAYRAVRLALAVFQAQHF